MLLEEFSGTWLLESPDDREGMSKVARAVAAIGPHLPAAWASRIDALSKQPWHTGDDGSICVFPRSECDRIVAQELAFPHLDEAFMQEAEEGA